MFSGHLLSTEGKHDGNDRTQRLRDRGYRKGNCEKERVYHRTALDHIDPKQDTAEYQDDDGQLPAKIIQVDLKGGTLLRGTLQKTGDLAHLCAHSDLCHFKCSPSVCGKASGEYPVGLVAQSRSFRYFIQRLLHRKTFAGQGALIHLQAGAGKELSVCRDAVACLHDHFISNRNLSGRDLDSLAVPDNLGLRRGQLLQAVQRLLRLHGLHRSQDGVHGDHHEDNQRTLRISQETGYNGGEDQNDHQEILVLLQEDLQSTLLLALHQLIKSILLLILSGLFTCQHMNSSLSCNRLKKRDLYCILSVCNKSLTISLRPGQLLIVLTTS